jgi:hypothetical protein
MAAAFRGLMARRPLLAHVAFGGALGATWELVDVMAMLEDDEREEEGESSDDSLTDEDIGLSLSAAAIVGGMQGAAMRWYYPWLESFVEGRFRPPSPSPGPPRARPLLFLAKVAVDHAPALISTVVLHRVSVWQWEKEYGLPADADTLRARAYEVVDRVQGVVADARREVESATSRSLPPLPPPRTATASMPSVADLEQVELIDTILSSQPSSANAVALAISAANFALVPRWLRGLVGTFQWQLWEALREEEGKGDGGSPVSIDSEVDVSIGEGGAGVDVMVKEEIKVRRRREGGGGGGGEAAGGNGRELR